MADHGIDLADAGDTAETWHRGLAGAVGLFAGLVLFVLVLLVAHGTTDRDAAQVRERHSYDILLLVRGLDRSMAQAEAALGRYVINGQRETGTLYYDNWKQAGRQLSRLSELTADNPRQAVLVAALRKAYDKRGAELAAPATRAFYKQGWAALSLFDRAGKSPTIAQVERILKQIEDNERLILGRRSDVSETSANWSNRMTRLLSGMGLLIGVSALLLGWLALNAFQQRRAARRAAEIEAARAMRLEAAVHERTRQLSEANLRLREEAATREAAEAQLRQIQKMEAVGQLTGGIAHDFNNMLAVVVGALEIARRRLGPHAEEARRHIDNALDGAARAAALTRRLLSFARAEPHMAMGLRPGALISDMSKLMDRTLGERIRIVTAGLGGDWLVRADPNQLENAIINLAVNARDAMEGEGTLTIAAEQIDMAEGDVDGLTPGQYVRILVTDTGCGMDQQTLERVFEPFFTTKPVGKGTGLGLSQVFGFARQTDGKVLIRSVPGQGTAVALYLPRYLPPADAQILAHPDDEEGEATIAEGLNVLVVEDDPRVRASTADVLTELGLEPICCESGEEALALLEQRSDIALVITDVVMPGMSGPELVTQIIERSATIPILFVTGFAGEADSSVLANHRVLRKPFTIRALSDAITAALRTPVNGQRRSAAGAAAG